MAKTLSVSSGLANSFTRIAGAADAGAFYNAAKDLLEAADALRELFDSQESGESKSSKVEITNKYTVSFEVGGGSAVSSQTVLWKEQAARPDDPTRDRYEFAGWYTDEALTQEYDFATKVTSSLTLYAGWTLVTAKITYNALNNKASTAQYVAIGEYATPIDDPEKSGYVFSCWCTDAACTTKFDFETTAITGDLVLYAAWEKLCNVFFDSQGGPKIETQSVKQSSLCSYPLTPVKENYIFLYWTDSYSYDEDTGEETFGGAFDFRAGIEDDITLYAVYEQVSNTLSFNSMGGTEFEPQSVGYGQKAAFPGIPEKAGDVFKRWSLYDGDSGEYSEYDFSQAVKEDLTLCAEWHGE